MKKSKDNDLADRRGAAAKAKAALLHAHGAAKEAAEPTRLERQKERMAAAEAREQRREARMRSKLEEQERLQAEAAELAEAADAAARAQADAREQALNHRVARVVQDEAARKAERDRRYANRKARQR